MPKLQYRKTIPDRTEAAQVYGEKEEVEKEEKPLNENRARYITLAMLIDEFMRYKSSTNGVEEQSTFAEIISMEEEGLAFLLSDLNHGFGSPHWRFLAIDRIAENRNLPEIKISPDQAGYVEAMIKIFLQWGRDNNFIS